MMNESIENLGNKSDTLTLRLGGRIDSSNAHLVESGILERLAGQGDVCVVLDAEELEYISSAGLRIILRLRKDYPKLKLINASGEVYDILEMTGFTELLAVERAYRRVSVEGCEVIGEGFNGKVYRIDRETAVKTYKNADALSEILHEREVARLALILGVPTAISYEVVRVGDSYGSVFELLDARSFARILAEEPERMDFCVNEYVKMLKKIHSIRVPAGKLPSMRRRMLEAIARLKNALADGPLDKLYKMTEALPESDRLVHGDCHTKNIVLAGDEVLLIDMDTLSVGEPIFELLHMYNAYIGYSEYDPQTVLDFQGFDAETARRFWRSTLKAYLEVQDERALEQAEEKVRCLSYAYLIDWNIRHSGLATEKDSAVGALWTERLTELLRRVDSLELGLPAPDDEAAEELDIEASVDKLPAVLDYINSHLEAAGCPKKTVMQIDLAVEETFTNISKYAYSAHSGRAKLRAEISAEPPLFKVTFTDRGIPYDPLKKEDPDLTLSIEERQIGGLGIFLTKKLMDEVNYEYRDGQNILTLIKKL